LTPAASAGIDESELTLAVHGVDRIAALMECTDVAVDMTALTPLHAAIREAGILQVSRASSAPSPLSSASFSGFELARTRALDRVASRRE
jgi:hypothetical protein